MNNNINISTMGKIPALMVREFYEHKTAFLTTPLVVASLFLLFVIGGLLTGQGEIMSVNGTHLSAAELLSMHSAENVDKVRQGLSAAMVGVGGTVLFILPFVIVFPLLNSLYEERIERSYLFWKSMPVSDLQEVLIKLGFIVFVGPMFLFAIATLLSFAVMLVVSVFLWSNEIPLVGLMWVHTPFISGWIGAAATYMIWALWALPVFGWILLASAYAPKAPLMYAIVPPIVLMVMERLLLRTEWLDNALASRLGEKFGNIMINVLDMDRYKSGNVNFNIPSLGEAGQVLWASVSDPSFWAGSVVAAIFITGAVYVRRYKT